MIQNLADENDNKRNTPSVEGIENETFSQLLPAVSSISWSQLAARLIYTKERKRERTNKREYRRFAA